VRFESEASLTFAVRLLVNLYQFATDRRGLTEVQRLLPDDIAVLNSLGTALLLGKKPIEALKAFDRVLQLSPQNPLSEQNVGMAFMDAGQLDAAAAHLERSLELDPLLLPAATALADIYRKQGDSRKEAALADQMRRAMK
jgi:predicted Zn-dependent protease